VAQLGSTVSMVVSKGPPPVAVPELVGKPEDVAHKKLSDLGLQMTVESPQTSTTIAKGCVLSVHPGTGSMVPKGGIVQVVISLGPPVYTVPDLVGLSLAEARSKVRDAHLQIDLEGSAGGNDQDVVASQTPAAGSQVTVPVVRVEVQPSSSESPAESSTLGNPQNALTVPDVIGQDEATARAAMADRGLTVAGVEHQENHLPPGTVFEVSPSVGTAVEPGTGVTLTVSSGLPSSESP
jgi:serine/threonine-protein kinase